MIEITKFNELTIGHILNHTSTQGLPKRQATEFGMKTKDPTDAHHPSHRALCVV